MNPNGDTLDQEIYAIGARFLEYRSMGILDPAKIEKGIQCIYTGSYLVDWRRASNEDANIEGKGLARLQLWFKMSYGVDIWLFDGGETSPTFLDIVDIHF